MEIYSKSYRKLVSIQKHNKLLKYVPPAKAGSTGQSAAQLAL